MPGTNAPPKEVLWHGTSRAALVLLAGALKMVPIIRLQWIDADGNSGQTDKNAADQHTAWTEGDQIDVCTDPKTGRDWWVEDLCPGQ